MNSKANREQSSPDGADRLLDWLRGHTPTPKNLSGNVSGNVSGNFPSDRVNGSANSSVSDDVSSGVSSGESDPDFHESGTASGEEAIEDHWAESSNLDIAPDASPDASLNVTDPTPFVGDIPAVQDRFNAILERRLRAEIEKNLPLFPWESQVMEYELEPELGVLEGAWAQRLRQFRFPVSMPDRVLASIFNRCQELVHQPLQEGIQIVRAIENLFPDATPMLHELTGTFLNEAVVRDHASLSDRVATLAATQGALPRHFDEASLTQQALLSMLAARELLQALQLNLTIDGASVRRNWALSAGDVLLEASCDRLDDPLRTSTASGLCMKVVGVVPSACQLRLHGTTGQTAQVCQVGAFHLELENIDPGEIYTLEIASAIETDTIISLALRISAS